MRILHTLRPYINWLAAIYLILSCFLLLGVWMNDVLLSLHLSVEAWENFIVYSWSLCSVLIVLSLLLSDILIHKSLSRDIKNYRKAITTLKAELYEKKEGDKSETPAKEKSFLPQHLAKEIDDLATIQIELQEASHLLHACIDYAYLEVIKKAGDAMVKCLQEGGKIISCGNGGSHCDAMHLAEELTGKFKEERPALAAIAISDPTYMSCVANDFGYEHVFSRFVEGVGTPHKDLLFAISTSGNSPNIVRAMQKAKEKHMQVILLTGKTGGKAQEYADVSIQIPYEGYANRIQEMHIKIIHILIQLIEQSLSTKI